MGNVNKINNYNHGSDRGMNANDIVRFISDNNLLHIHSDLGTILSCSSEVNICFLNFFKVLRDRGENFDEKRVITSILKKPEYNNEKDLLIYLNNLIKLASKRDKDGKYFIPPKYVKILADFKNWETYGITLEKKLMIKNLIGSIENGSLPSSSFAKITNIFEKKMEFGGIKASKLSSVEKKNFIDQLSKSADNDWESSKIFSFQKSYLHHYHLDLCPDYVVEIGSEKIFFTKKILASDAPRIIGYSINGDKFDMNFYRCSNSEGYWRFIPEILDGGSVSKAEDIQNSSYESTTKVIYPLNYVFHNFESFPGSVIRNPFDLYDSLNTFYGYSKPSKIPILKNSLQIESYLGKPLLGGAVKYYKGRKFDDVKAEYDHFLENSRRFNLKNMVLGTASYSYKHPFLGNVVSQECCADFDGRPIKIFFSYVDGDLERKVWIDFAVFGEKNTHELIYQHQLNLGLMLAKPIDYVSQCPKDDNGFLPLVTKENGYLDDAIRYKDIRCLYQDSPLIKKFKELKGRL